MLRIRPYRASDAGEILSWCGDEKTFYRWTAGMMGAYPLTREDFSFVELLMPFTAFDETGNVGFFTLRNPNGNLDELRLGFVIVNPDRRAKGCGKQMLRLGLEFAFELYGAERVTLRVFENNPAACACYRSLGFHEPEPKQAETHAVFGEEWVCREMQLEREA